MQLLGEIVKYFQLLNSVSCGYIIKRKDLKLFDRMLLASIQLEHMSAEAEAALLAKYFTLIPIDLFSQQGNSSGAGVCGTCCQEP